MKAVLPFVVLACFTLMVRPAQAQHCAPISESYLSLISIKHDPTGQSLNLKLDYSKRGGAFKEKYQIYLLAYLEKDEERVPGPATGDLIDKKVVRVLQTEVTQRDKEGTFPFRLQLDVQELAKKIIELGRLTDKDRQDFGGWGRFEDNFRLAVFVPFLDDRAYSVLPGLPDDRHECNYDRRRVLLFQKLPYSFGIRFGIVQGVQLPKDRYQIQINEAKSTRERPAR